MRTRRAAVAAGLTATLAASLGLAGSAAAAPAPALVEPGTVDITATLDLPSDPGGSGPKVFQALGVVPGDGAELTSADLVENPSDWCGDLRVDLDPVEQTARISADDQACYTEVVTLEITGWNTGGLHVLTDTLGSTEEGVVVGATALEGEYGDGYLSLAWWATQDAFYTDGAAVLGYVTADPFVDVWYDDQFAWHMQWLTQHDIATGYADGSFRPTAPVSRQAMAAFLHRFAVEFRRAGDYTAPEVSPFVDVPTTHPFYTDVAWLADAGISNGTVQPDGSRWFLSTSAVSRQAMAAFLFRLAGWESYEAPEVSPFLDVPTSHAFYREIAWLAEVGISTGTVTAEGSFFSPTQEVSRRAMAAFLYRATQVPNP